MKHLTPWKSPHQEALANHRCSVLLGEPAFDHIPAILGFPLLEQLVIAALCFDDFTIMRVLILLHLPRTTRCLLSCWGGGTTVGLRIQDVDDVAKAVAVLGQ